jgi:hypothetical protein
MLILGRKSDPQLQPTDLRALAEETLHLCPAASNTPTSPRISKAPPTPARADPAQLKQVLLNLILNATDAMPQGGAITIRTTTRDQTAHLEIDDTGSGVTLKEGQDPFAWFSTTKSAGGGHRSSPCANKSSTPTRGGSAWRRLENGDAGLVRARPNNDYSISVVAARAAASSLGAVPARSTPACARTNAVHTAATNTIPALVTNGPVFRHK